MIFGIGTDIIEVERMKKALERNNALKDRLFSAEEQAYCEGNALIYQHYAVRFAAKESIFKALGTGYRDGMEFNEITVLNNHLGKPDFVLSGKVAERCAKEGVTAIHLSVSHVKETAVAFVVMEK